MKTEKNENLHVNASIPLSVAGVSHKFKDSRLSKFSQSIFNPLSPNYCYIHNCTND